MGSSLDRGYCCRLAEGSDAALLKLAARMEEIGEGVGVVVGAGARLIRHCAGPGWVPPALGRRGCSRGLAMAGLVGMQD